MEKAPALKTWYTALAQLADRRESILQALYERNHTASQLYLYDITSSHFEGDTCELAAFGYNRDSKKGKKQIVVGVICEERGCPIWVSDQTTVKQQLLSPRDKLGVEDFTLAGDRGMVTHARIEELEQEGWWESFRYITALTRAEMLAKLPANGKTFLSQCRRSAWRKPGRRQPSPSCWKACSVAHSPAHSPAAGLSRGAFRVSGQVEFLVVEKRVARNQHRTA